MAIFRLHQDTVHRLLTLPESGMGYQVLPYRSGGLVVFNATIAIPLKELRSRAFSSVEYAYLAGNPDGVQVRVLQVITLDDVSVIFSIFDKELRKDTFGISFSETVVEPPENTISSIVPHSNYRYCAYYRDRRVDPMNGDYLSGTYATTYPDMHFVPSGFAAVGRYALPNPASARYVFPIVTFDRPSLMGTATPNFGQAGGGVEVLFSNGAKNSPGISFSINVG